jgi:hypothetical protein
MEVAAIVIGLVLILSISTPMERRERERRNKLRDR